MKGENKMKSWFAIGLMVIVFVCGWLIGFRSTITAEGWIDEERNEFVIEVFGNEFSWDISEG